MSLVGKLNPGAEGEIRVNLKAQPGGPVVDLQKYDRYGAGLYTATREGFAIAPGDIPALIDLLKDAHRQACGEVSE